ncbi:reverse transcriptase [Plakobranchus ocellatus]|uniref:Reverse transcriptase n=1 Tax=Plakobranchus ocellatus TaxID=259542 RepID=A0AAV3ZAE3_9GAST|nr:reverse transcriptase [Plakobranchus ocellatus]
MTGNLSRMELTSCGKARLMTMLEDSENAVVKSIQPQLKTDRKWSAGPTKGNGTSIPIRSGTKSWCGSVAGVDTERKSLLDGNDDWKFLANILGWNKHPKVIQDTGIEPDILFYSSATRQIIMVELTVPYESRMEEINAYKREKYKDLSKEKGKHGYKSQILLIVVVLGGCWNTSLQFLSKLSINSQ